MTKVILPKIEYEQLKRQAAAYQKFAANFFEFAIQDPIGEVVKDFRNTDIYNESFLRDLESGLRKSSYSKQYANKALKKRSRAVRQEA